LGTISGFIQAAVWGVGYGGYFEKPDNEIFGMREMTDKRCKALWISFLGSEIELH
jgi:hypothetical protein